MQGSWICGELAVCGEGDKQVLRANVLLGADVVPGEAQLVDEIDQIINVD
jgi:hypothetical protein